MAWLRAGDTIATHPIVLAVLEHLEADDRDVNEVFGFVMRCALQSAANDGDYVISYGTAITIAGTKAGADRLLELAEYAGYVTRAETLEGRPAFKLHEDPDFIHLRSKEEIDFERQRDRDRKDQGLTFPVWLRDGDACRYCRRIVSWTDKKSRRRGTFDHLIPGEAATHDTYVVACKGCNGALADMSFEERSKHLLPAPAQPHFSREGVKYWSDTDWAREHKDVIPKPTTASKLRPGDFIPGATKISTFIQDVQKRNQKKTSDGSQPPSASVPGSGPQGSAAGSQPTADPAEPNQSRGPKGTAGRSPVHPARDTASDGPKGMAENHSVRPASLPTDDGPSDSSGNQPEVDPASSEPNPLSEPPEQGKHRLRNDSGIIPESAGTEGWKIRNDRVGTGRVGPGRVGPGLVETGRGGTGARQRPARPTQPRHAGTQSVKRRRKR